MYKMKALAVLVLVGMGLYSVGCLEAQAAGGLNEPPEGFVALFNGVDLTGWKGLLAGPYDNPIKRAKLTPEQLAVEQAKADKAMRKHWKVVDGILEFDGGGYSLATIRDYGDFEMLVDWKVLHANGDSGLYLRGSPQVQIWDPEHSKIGSGGLYNNQKNPSKPSKIADNPIGQWNTFRIKMVGERVTVHLNGELVVDNVVLENYWDRSIPIFASEQIELQCHGDPIHFRNIFIREIPQDGLTEEQKAQGFVALFNGKDLAGWKGLLAGPYDNPIKRAKLTPEQLVVEQAKADKAMRKHWKVVDGILEFDGGGYSLATIRDYGDFEMLVDWKVLHPNGDSGLYLRGSPQVQIWDPEHSKIGSGGLYNNQKNPSKPSKIADNPIGQWNTFRIKMVGERVTVHLNGELVVDNVVLENYWDRSIPIFATEQIELQCHGDPIHFRNIYIREIGRDELTEEEKAQGFVSLFNGSDLTGWVGDKKGYAAEDGKIVVKPELGAGNLFTEKQYDDFVFRFEFKLTPGANNGLGIRTLISEDVAFSGMELQILDDTADKYKELKPYQYHGSVYGVVPAKTGHLKPVGQWNYQEVIADGHKITVKLNGQTIVDKEDVIEASTPEAMDGQAHPGLKRKSGHIGFLGHGSRVEFRNIRIVEMDKMTNHPMTDVYDGWRLGVQAWSFNDFTFFEAVEKVASLGLDWIEAYPGQKLNADDPGAKFHHSMSADERKAAQEKLREFGVRVVNYGVVGLGNDEAQCREVFDFAKEMGIETIVSEPPADAFDLIDKLCQEYKIKVAIHNHPKPSPYWNPDTVLKVCQGRSKWIGACADTGHWMRSGVDPLEALKKLKGRIVSLHFKDINEFGNPGAHDTIWGTGKGDVKAMLKELDKQGFVGVFSIEYEHNWGKSLPDIRQCVESFGAIAGPMKLTGWRNLFADDLSNAIYKAGTWTLQDGVLARKGGGDVWSKEKFADFVLDFGFKIAKNTNSGVFIRTGNTKDWLPWVEVQVLDSYGKDKPGKHDCGGIFDVLAPSANTVKRPGEWNRMTITAKANKVNVALNGREVVDMDLDLWTEAHKNPDGTRNKFGVAYKDLPRVGHFGFQDHGQDVWYRNVRIKEL